MKETEIEQLRKKLDSIDDSISALLSERVDIALKIIDIKKASGLPVEDLNRESEILKRVSLKNPAVAPLLKVVFRRIFDWVKSRHQS
ncbi:MAG TPA: chorismate mutase [bacterium]|nr:chorismate mutase [bacterium]HPS29513.1 chorismate mutase [bacterium]